MTPETDQTPEVPSLDAATDKLMNAATMVLTTVRVPYLSRDAQSMEALDYAMRTVLAARQAMFARAVLSGGGGGGGKTKPTNNAGGGA